MSDEIKEILDRLERIDHKEYIAFEFADSATFDEMARCFEERKKLADYITNLQQENDRLNNIINELEEYIKPYLYMLNGIQNRDIYEQCQLDDFTDIMEKLQELKENK